MRLFLPRDYTDGLASNIHPCCFLFSPDASAAKGVSAPPLYVLEFSSPFTPLLAVRALQGLNQGGGKHTLCEIVADDAKVRGLNCGLDSYPGRGRAPPAIILHASLVSQCVHMFIMYMY